jgi:L-2,4-diaminobutyrate decarboxylase
MTDVPHVYPDSSPDGEESSHKAGALRDALRAGADRVADYLEGVANREIFPADARAPEGDLFPARGENLETLFDDAADWAEANAVHVAHPGYAGHMDSGVAVAGILGDLLASALNQNLLAYELAPGATLLEKKLVALFAERAGLGDGAGGIFTTGGTVANLTALLLARNAASRDASRSGLAGEHPLCVLTSADAHYSVQKACAVLGMGSERVLQVPVSGPERRLDPQALPDVYVQAVARGMRPIALVASAGTTSCGAIDPLPECADFCEDHGLWLHVDGAHGGVLLLHGKERARLHGIHRADSVTLDPHKWLYVPKSAGVLLVRRGEDLVTAD